MFGQDTLREAAIITPEQLENYRSSLRKPVRLDVTVYCHGYEHLRCEARELGPDGLVVAADDFPTSRHAYLEVEFTLNDRKGLKLYRLPVYAASMTPEGTELRFVNTYISAFRYIDSEQLGGELEA